VVSIPRVRMRSSIFFTGWPKSGDRIVATVTHSLGHLDLYDSVLVLYGGRVVYHGPPGALAHYFGVALAEEVYPALAMREPEQWGQSWEKYREEYYATMPGFARTESTPPAPGEGREGGTPGFLTQLQVLLARRWAIFFRDRTQLLLQLAMLLIFPVVVVSVRLRGDPSRLNVPPETLALNPAAELVEQIDIQKNRMEVGGLLSGLVMFQVVLLALMGSNNSAREIAGERLIFEKEKLGGLRVSSYLGSKLFFLAGTRSGAIGVDVPLRQHLCPNADFRVGPWRFADFSQRSDDRDLSGISASMTSPDQASLLSIYLVGFQLPLSRRRPCAALCHRTVHSAVYLRILELVGDCSVARSSLFCCGRYRYGCQPAINRALFCRPGRSPVGRTRLRILRGRSVSMESLSAASNNGFPNRSLVLYCRRRVISSLSHATSSPELVRSQRHPSFGIGRRLALHSRHWWGRRLSVFGDGGSSNGHQKRATTATEFNLREYLDNANSLRGNSYRLEGTVEEQLRWTRRSWPFLECQHFELLRRVRLFPFSFLRTLAT